MLFIWRISVQFGPVIIAPINFVYTIRLKDDKKELCAKAAFSTLKSSHLNDLHTNSDDVIPITGRSSTKFEEKIASQLQDNCEEWPRRNNSAMLLRKLRVKSGTFFLVLSSFVTTLLLLLATSETYDSTQDATGLTRSQTVTISSKVDNKAALAASKTTTTTTTTATTTTTTTSQLKKLKTNDSIEIFPDNASSCR